MTKQILNLCAAALLAASTAAFAQTSDASVPPAAAAKQASEVASGADPVRWSMDDGSRATRLATLKKEIGAAQAEALAACAKQAADTRNSCVAAARATYLKDMAAAGQQVDTAPGGSVTTTRTTVTPASR
jgi:type VI protein secretion system component VasK